MARKGERYSQTPTLWYLGYGYPCRVMRRRHVRDRNGRWRWRWLNWEHDVLTKATVGRWLRLVEQGKAQVRRDVTIEMFMQAGIIPTPKRKEWAR